MAEIVAFKARNAGNSRSIAKFRNAESGDFRLQMSVNGSIRGSLGDRNVGAASAAISNDKKPDADRG
ncbi:MAG: hypothetical protein H6981_09660 [Gammaproteobacteria bacterium]|nr:hypothetical protein [Gammaproteobacteria bacterium]